MSFSFASTIVNIYDVTHALERVERNTDRQTFAQEIDQTFYRLMIVGKPLNRLGASNKEIEIFKKEKNAEVNTKT